MTEVDPPATAAPVGRGRWYRVLRWSPSVLMLLVLARMVADRWSALPSDSRLPSWPALLAAVVVNMMANVLLADTWRAQVLLTGQTIGRRQAVGVWSSSQFARLLFPGATIGARVMLGNRAGVSGRVTAATTLLELVWSVLSQPLMIVATMPWWVQLAPELRWAGLATIVPLAALVVLVAAPMQALRLALRVLRPLPVIGGRMPSVDRVEAAAVDRVTTARLGARYLLNAALRDAAFVALLATLVSLDGTEVAAAVGAVALGRLVGLLAVFAPAGVGPREGVTVLVLAPVTGAGVAIVAVAAARLVEVVGEVLTWLASRGAGPAAVADPPLGTEGEPSLRAMPGSE